MRAQAAATRQAGVQIGRGGEDMDGIPVLDSPPADADAAVPHTPPKGMADAVAGCAGPDMPGNIAPAFRTPGGVTALTRSGTLACVR